MGRSFACSGSRKSQVASVSSTCASASMTFMASHLPCLADDTTPPAVRMPQHAAHGEPVGAVAAARGEPLGAVAQAAHGEPVEPSRTFSRHSSGGWNPEGVLPLNKVCNRRRNLSILLPGLRVNRVLYLSILSTLRRSAQGHGLLPATIEQGAHRFEKLGGGPIDHIYGWAPSYKRGLWVVQGRRSYNQRTRTGRDRDRGGCQWLGLSR